jgi:hypothetical protein
LQQRNDVISGAFDGTSGRVDNQTIAWVERAVEVDAIPYQDRGQRYAKLFRNGREIIARLNDVDPLFSLLTPFLVSLVEALLKSWRRIFRKG